MSGFLRLVRRELAFLLRGISHLNSDHGLHGHHPEIR
jgi:hypothetical protein